MTAMDSFSVRQDLVKRVRLRGYEAPDPAALGWADAETIVHGTERLHLVAQPALVRRVLADTSLRTFPQMAVLNEMCAHFGLDGAVAEEFFVHSPIFLDGESHREARRHFARMVRRAQDCLRPQLDDLAEAHFEAMSRIATRTGLATAGVIAFVDRLLVRVFEDLLPGSEVHYPLLAVHPQSLFEFVCHPRRLRGTLEGMTAFMNACCGDADDRSEARALMGFVLMGRDPLIGALADFLHLWHAQPVAQRSGWLAEMLPRDVFRRTRPVNLMSRVATGPLEETGLDVRAGELVVLMLMARDREAQVCPGTRDDLAFGHGSHLCVGMPLSVEIAEAWMRGLQRWEKRIPWQDLLPEEPVPSVFRRYRGSGAGCR